MTLVWLPAVLIIPLVIFALLWIMPQLRANYLVWRGKERQARRLLETMVEQNPAKLQLYTKIARIYYLDNRRDRRAIRIFEMIVKFKIPFDWRDELYTILAKHYIVEGRKDTEAIRLIEKAVDKELKRLRN